MLDARVLAFTGIAALVTLTPGADTMLVVRSALVRGRRGGMLTVLGVCAGLFVHAILSALGLSVILVFVGIKMLLAHIYKIPIGISLAFIGGVLLISILVSIWLARWTAPTKARCWCSPTPWRPAGR